MLLSKALLIIFLFLLSKIRKILLMTERFLGIVCFERIVTNEIQSDMEHLVIQGEKQLILGAG